VEDFEDRGPGSFRGWLGKILQHKVNDQVRSHVGVAKRSLRRESPPGPEVPEVAVPDPASSPSQRVAKVEEWTRVLDAMRDLPDAEREVLRLVHLEGLNYREAGERLGRSANTTLKLYGRALARLTERLSLPGEPP
jgi:RNA polymerase sigma factor (sigma-70 family)